MSTSNTKFSRALTLLGSLVAAIALSSCQPPVLFSGAFDPNDEASQGETAQRRIAGENIDSSCHLIIDGEVDGTGTAIPANLTFGAGGAPYAIFHIAQNASPGAHSVVVGNETGL